MAVRDLREWLSILTCEGEVKKISTEVDWKGEIGAITRKVYSRQGPALLFENIRGYQNTISTKLFTGGLATKGRMAMMLGMPRQTSIRDLVEVVRQRAKQPIEPVMVEGGPVKENILKGGDIDLYQFPVPQWHHLDGGRYINTFCAVITKDPETGIRNVGLYRGVIQSKDEIGVLLVPGQGWGIHYLKYQQMGKPMPVAVAYGWDESLVFSASTPFARDADEYGITGALRQEPVELVKCETVDLEVPAWSEIVVEGFISPDPQDYKLEGPFGEYTGYYGEAAKRPVIKVSCITHRDDPIFRGTLEGMDHANPNEDSSMLVISLSAVAKNILESQGVPGVLEVSAVPITLVKIKKMFRGHAKQVASALWGSSAAQYLFKFVIVVEEDTDIWNRRAVEGALSYRVNAAEDDIVIFPGSFGAVLDPSTRVEDRDEIRFGTGKWARVLIDATRNWNYPRNPQWGNEIYPPRSTTLSPEEEELVSRRWKEYGLD
jgi:4-hydroxy-3-polyprenylbenzoate decarboxylase